MKPSPWFCLEAIPGLIALEADWQHLSGPQYPSLRALCLQPSNVLVQRVPCPRGCGCNHWVIPRHDGDGAVAICQCTPPDCPDLHLTAREVIPLELNFTRLGHALCRAFGLAPRQAQLPPPATFQFGSWSSNAVPAILTIQTQNADFHRALAEVAAHLRRPFMLFAPTSDFLDAPCLAILENYGAAFFALDSHLLLTEQASLQPTASPGQLFARFNPQPRDLDLDTAQRVFALVHSLDTDKPLPAPSLVKVFRFYCVEELSALETARKCRCSKATVVRRLQLIHRQTGVAPQQLRRLSPHLAKLQDSLRDPRAARLRPQAALEQEDEEGQDYH